MLTTASLAVKPVTRAVAEIQSPKPRGAKTGASSLPMSASMESALLDTIISRRSKLCKIQMTMEAMKMMVKALTRKSLAFSQQWSSTVLGEGKR